MILYNKNKIGFILSEAVVSVSIIAGFVIVILGVNTFYFNIAVYNKQPLQASLMLEEGIEALKFLRDSSWGNNIGNKNINTNYYLIFNNGWSLGTSLVQNDIYTRTINLQNVYRNANDDIDQNGAVLDPNTKLITINVSWSGKKGLDSRETKIYLSNVFDN